MEQVQLTSRVRTATGKGAARQLRREGLIPAVLYGGPSGNIALSVNSHDLRQIIVKSGGEHALISLAVEDEAETKNLQVILKDLQLDPVKQTLVHADFLEVTMGQVLEIEIPFELTGESPGVKAGGVLEFVTRQITVKCLPTKLRDHISVDISSLEIGDILTVSDIDLGEDYEILTHADVVIATIAAPLAEEVLEAPEEEQVEPEIIQKGKKVEEEE